MSTRITCDDKDYPILYLNGDAIHKDLELHFLHYHSVDEAISAWNRRKERINYKKLFVVWTFSYGKYDETLYERFENLPIKNKIAFVNHDIDRNKYPHLFYLKGFESQDSLTSIFNYNSFFGYKYYDQFDWITWFKEGICQK